MCRISSAILRQAVYGTIKFGTYYTLKTAVTERWRTDYVIIINAICAALAGAVSSAIANPTDVIKVRMQVTGVKRDMSLFACFQDVYKYEGIRGLWRVMRGSLIHYLIARKLSQKLHILKWKLYKIILTIEVKKKYI